MFVFFKFFKKLVICDMFYCVSVKFGLILINYFIFCIVGNMLYVYLLVYYSLVKIGGVVDI